MTCEGRVDLPALAAPDGQPAPASYLLIGQRISHYRLLEQIGAGGMGVVYRTQDERLGRHVALKALPAGTLAGEAARKRFRQEALTLSQLNHPNLATVHDFDTRDGIDFLVMERVTGVSLAPKLASGPVPQSEAAALGGPMAEALEEAHGHAAVHRDLKPANVVVTPKVRAKVSDFGLAKLIRRTGPDEIGARATAGTTEDLLTTPGTAIGTVMNLACEGGFLRRGEDKAGPAPKRASGT